MNIFWRFAGWVGKIASGVWGLASPLSEGNESNNYNSREPGRCYLAPLFLGFRLVAYRRTGRKEASSQVLLRGDGGERERTWLPSEGTSCFEV